MTAAIPTRYGGCQFRSRLEARWAVMFDQLQWHWEYEPVDLHGYIPDFVLMFPAGQVLVEVKPAFTVEALITEAAEKIDRSGWKSVNLNDALIVGATWNVDGVGMTDHPLLGAVRQNEYWVAAEWIQCPYCHRPATYHYAMAWACAVCGEGGKVYRGDPNPNIKTMWAEAGNAVQWRPRRRR